MYSSCYLCNGEIFTHIEGVKDYEYHVPGTWAYECCSSCGVLQIKPFPSSHSELSSYYPVNYHKFNKSKLFNFLNNIILKIRIMRLKINSNGPIKIIDVGAGDMRFLKAVSSRFFVERAVAIDLSFDGIGKAGDIEFTNQPFVETLFDLNTFDIVVMNNYLEHTMNPVQELQKAYSYLKKGGVICGLLPNFDRIDRKIFGKYWGGMHTPRHLYHFDLFSLNRYLRAAGFSAVKVKNEMHPGHISISINNLLIDKLLILGPRIPLISFLTILLLPISIFFSLFLKNGSMKFYAIKQ